jgi:HAD superfamily, subfamily IIIB (Acid phosphatase)
MNLVLLLLLGQTAEPLEQSLKKVAQRHELRSVVSESAQLSRLGKRPVVVFDVDDTLYGATDGSLYTDHKDRVEEIRGASQYLHTLAKTGAKIVYLTGRGESWRKATEAQFQKFDFPLSGPHELMLNPSKDWEVPGAALAFKRSVHAQILTKGRPVAFFDNDKANVRLFREQYPDSKVFRLRTRTARPDPGGNGKILVIDDYRPALGRIPRRK